MMQLEFEIGDKVRVTMPGTGMHGEYTVSRKQLSPKGSRYYTITNDAGHACAGIPERYLQPILVPMKQAISNAVDRLARQVGTCPPKAVYSLSEVARKLNERAERINSRVADLTKVCTCTGWQLLHRGHLDTCPGRDNG